MEFVELSADDPGHVAAVVELRNRVREHEAPWLLPATTATVEGYMRNGWDLEPGRAFGGFAGDRLAAHGVVNTTEWDNLELAWLGLSVHPDERGRGLGHAMFAHVEGIAREMGRTKLGVDAWDGSPGVGFAERRDYTVASLAVNRRQHLAEIPLGRIRGLYAEAEAAASAYELVRVTGRTPEDLLDAVAELSAAINDAPLDDLDLEDEAYPPQRIRDYETAIERRGERQYRLLARHRGTGVLAGHTVVAVEKHRPEVGHQHDTTVAATHRGHRLGLLLKGAMNLWLAEEEPQLEVIDTWNAESNRHMVAVNEALGYRCMAREVQLQKTVSGPPVG